MAADFEALPTRPTQAPNGRRPNPLGEAVVGTVKTGGSVRVSLNGESYARLFQRLYHFCRTRQLHFRTQKQDDGSFIVWAEEKPQ